MVENVQWCALLVESGAISHEQLEDAARLAQLQSLPLPGALLFLDYADAWAITQAIATQHRAPQINFYDAQVPEEIILTVPDVVARDMEILPVAICDSRLWCATPHLDDLERHRQLTTILNRDVRPLWAPHRWVHQALQDYYEVGHVTECGSATYYRRYSDDQWLLVAGNHFREYVERR